jgi:hypothetical protein
MSQALRSLALAVAASVLLASAAQAASPIRIGDGVDAHVAVDAAGTAYIAWRGNESLYTSLHFCRLPRAASACDKTATMAVKGDSLTRPFVTVSGSRVTVLQYRYGLTDGLTPDKFAAVVLYTSTDGGGSFDPGRYVGTVPFTDAAVGPGDGVSLATNAVTQGEFYQWVPLGGTGVSTTSANLSVDHPYNGAVALVDAATPVVVFADGSANGQFRRYGGSGDINDAASWTPAKDVGFVDYPHLAGGPDGLFMVARNSARSLDMRKFASDSFGTATVLPDSSGETPQDHLVQDAGGLLHVLLPQITASGSRLYYATSGSGTTFATTKFAFEPLAQGVRAAFNAGHYGMAVWSGSGDRVVRGLWLEPLQKPKLPSKVPAQAKRSGAKVKVTLKGKIPVPAGLRSVDVCNGKLKAQVKSTSKTVKLGSSCAFKGRLSVKVPGTKVTLKLSFLGNEFLKKAKKSYKLKIR